MIVTGGSGGIGLEICRRFGALGARVGLIARDVDALAVASRLVGGQTCAVSADVADGAALARAVAQIEAALGATTVLVNNAGVGHRGAVVDTDQSTFLRMIEVNYLGAVHATALVLPGMLARRRGHIVNVGSIAGRIGAPFEAAYSASKFALVGYTEALAAEVAGSGVSVALVQAGPVATGFAAPSARRTHRLEPRPVAPDRVAAAVVAAVEHHRAEQFVPRWLRVACAVKAAVPAAHRAGVRRLFDSERRELLDRRVR